MFIFTSQLFGHLFYMSYYVISRIICIVYIFVLFSYFEYFIESYHSLFIIKNIKTDNFTRLD